MSEAVASRNELDALRLAARGQSDYHQIFATPHARSMRPSGQMRHGVFISYARSDGEAAARALHHRLAAEAPDVETWLDRFDIEGGVGWWRQIDEALDRAEYLLLVMTPAAMRSENTRREWRSAKQKGVCVYPVKAAPDPELDFSALPLWMKKAHFYDPELEWPKLVAHLRRGCQATHVPFMAPSLPSKLVAREEVSNALASLLLADDKPRLVALRGAGGFGKTTLAAAICHDERVIEAYDDGILWVTLGQSPNLLNETVKLYAALTGQRPGFVDEDDAARELAGKLADKNCLIVIDDVWRAGHVKRFLLGGRGCAHLVTTRLLEVASEARAVEVDQMTSAQAVALLAARSGAADLDPQRSVRLTARLGLWPLAIKLAGSAMRQRIDRGDSGAKALEYVERAIDKRGITAFDRHDVDERSEAVARTIGASLDLLDEVEQSRCVELAAFPEDKAVPLQAVAHLWQCDDLDCEDLARRLDELALVELDLRHGTLRMHDTLRAFMSAKLAEPASLHAALLDAWGDPHALPYPYAWRNYAYHMQCAGRRDGLRGLLLDPRWLSEKVAATDIHAVIGDFEFLEASSETSVIRDALRLSAPALAVDPTEWRSQLHGRLLGHQDTALASFLNALGSASSASWLRLLHPSMEVPGGMLRMTLGAHAMGVTSLSSDAQQKYLVSGSSDRRVKLWDWPTGRLIATLPDRGLDVTAVALSADGSRALIGGADGLLELWDIENQVRLEKFSARNRRGIRAIAMSSDACLAVSASRDVDVLVWDLCPPQVIHPLRGHSESTTSVALSADGALTVTGSDDCTVRLWNTRTGALVQTFSGHTDAINAVALSDDGLHVLSGSTDQSVRLWDCRSGECLRTMLGHDASVTAIALAGSARRGLSGASDASIRLWDLATGDAVGTLTGHSDAVRAAIMSTDGKLAATASADRTIKLWQLDRPLRPSASSAHQGAVMALAFSPDGRLCASGGVDGCIKIRRVGTGETLRTIDGHKAPIRSLAFTADGSCVLSAGIEDKYWMWTVATGERFWVPISHPAPVDFAGFSTPARYLMTCCRGETVHLWEVPSGAALVAYGSRRLFDHWITPSSKRPTSPQDDELIDVYLPGEAKYTVEIIRMSRNGRHAMLSAIRHDPATRAERSAPGGADGACLLVFDISTGGVRSVTAPQTDVITAFDTDESGERLLWAAADGALVLWDLGRDTLIMRCPGTTGKINAVALFDDSRHAMSCSSDGALALWNLASGEREASLTADAALRSLAMAPDGRTVAVGDVGGQVHFFQPEFRQTAQ